MKEQDKNSEEDLNEMEISNLPNKKFKVMVKNMLTELGKRIDEHGENLNKETENIRMYQTEVTELKNTIIELKNALKGFNSRLDEVKK